MQSTTLTRAEAGPGVATTLGLCFIVALLEGLDLQSIGVAAPRMAREFGLSVGQMGLAFSAGTFGLKLSTKDKSVDNLWASCGLQWTTD
ncbi:hypothetical protein ACQCRO_04865, partial [Ralstonia pseudosolanacearum]